MSDRKIRMAVLGSTGSIGRSVLDVVSRHPERFDVVSLSAWTSVELLSEQARAFGARSVATAEGEGRGVAAGPDVRVLEGSGALEELAGDPDVDVVVNALVGSSGLVPTMAGVRAGSRVCIANKESLVAAGELIMAEAARSGAAIVPVDSEHSSLFRCLRGTPAEEVEALVLTASGGPLRDLPLDEMAGAELSTVLAHPTWDMGEKVTVDSASLVNKAMEVVEARWLFDVPFDRIEVLVHRESIVHSLVRLVDGSMLAHMGPPDMRIPIQYALLYPEVTDGAFETCRLEELGALHFEPVEAERYPCFELVLAAGRAGGTSPAVAASADEVAVHAFTSGAIRFGDIAAVIEGTLAAVGREPAHDLDSILAAERRAKAAAERLVAELAVAS